MDAGNREVEPEPGTIDTFRLYQDIAVVAPTTPRREKVATITRQDFDLLCEGEAAPRWHTRRDTCLGISATALAGAAGVYASTSYFVPGPVGGPATVPNIGAFLATAVLLIGAVACGLNALWAYFEGRRPATRGAYRSCCERIERQLT